MLLKLRVKKIALIDEMDLEFGPGLNVLSGETGAGKSIVMGALGLVLGERASAGQVREGESQAMVEAVFLPDDERQVSLINSILLKGGLTAVDSVGVVIMAREIMSGGRSLGRVNGRTVPVSFLKELGNILVDLHGQHQHQSLLHRENQRDILDMFGGEALRGVREKTGQLWHKLRQRKKELEKLGLNKRERERQLDLLQFQIKEIDEASLSAGEEEEHRSRESVLANIEKISLAVSETLMAITGDSSGGYTGSEYTRRDNINEGRSLQDSLARAKQKMENVVVYDDSLKPVLDLLEAAYINLTEAGSQLSEYINGVEFDYIELEKIQQRLEIISGLKRKYGDIVAEILEYASEAKKELMILQNSEETASELEKIIGKLEQDLADACQLLNSERSKAAMLLEERLHKILPELALEKARFKVAISLTEIGEKGYDRVEFMFSANPGESTKPLSDIISGGEMSRLMLAIKTVLAGFDEVSTMVFDEIDSGIGGVVIHSVAEKLAFISAERQVLVVTHSPHIAALADGHHCLYKEVTAGRTFIKIRQLSGDEIKKELSRMLSGGYDDASLHHVEAMLENARHLKEKL